MPRFEASRLIRRPLSEVFALVADGVQVGSIGTEPEGQLLRHEIEVEHVDGPRVGLGATYQMTNRVGPARPEEFVFTTAEYECNRRVAFRSDRAYDTVYDLEEEDGATRLICAREYSDLPKRLLGRLVSRLALKEELVVPAIEQELVGIELALGSAERSAGPAQPDEDDPAGTPSSSTQGPPDDCRASTIIALPPSAVFAFVANPQHRAMARRCRRRRPDVRGHASVGPSRRAGRALQADSVERLGRQGGPRAHHDRVRARPARGVPLSRTTRDRLHG